MLIAPHFLVGTAIAMSTPEAWPAGLAALTSHFVLDAIPHRDTIGGFHINKANVIMELFDVAFTLAVFFLLVPPSRWLYGLAISGVAILPDLLAVPGLFWPRWHKVPVLREFHHWHTQKLQYDRRDLNWFWGLLPQVLVTAVAIYFIITRPLA